MRDIQDSRTAGEVYGQRRKKKKRKKNRHGLIMIVIVAVILLAVASGTAFYFLKGGLKKAKTPEEVFNEFFDAVKRTDYASAYEMLHADSKAAYPKETFTERYKNIYEGIEAENLQTVCSSSEQREKSVVVYGRVTMDSLVGEISFKCQMTMMAGEDKSYSIVWHDSIILPNLEKTDKVRVISREPERGSLLDRRGALLAGKGKVTSVGLVPGKMSDDAQADKERLAGMLDLSVEEIDAKLSQSWVKEDSFVPVKMIQWGQNEFVQMLIEIPGVLVTDAESRIYPLGAAASHLTGYVQGVTAEDIENYPERHYTAASVIGRSGLEALYEERLRGETGYEVYIEKEDGSKKITVGLKAQKNGEDIRLTIDADLQRCVYNEMMTDKSASVLMNPKTGEVLALVSRPAYDANDFIYGMSVAHWQSLNEREDKPLLNRFRATWSPGSSFKPLVAGAGLTTGKLDASEDFGHSGLSWQKDASWGGYYVTTLHEYQGAVLENALIYSDNIYFAKAALKMGADVFTTELPKLGFGEQMPFPIWMTESQYSNSEGFDSEIQLADTGYGQGQVLVNPLHMACMYSAFVNDGSMVMPKLLLEEAENAEMWKEQVFSKDAVDKIGQALVEVIENPDGTGHGCYFENMKLAGKTGTAEIKATQDDTTGTELGWFVVYTPEASSENALCMVTMVEDVKDKGGSSYVVNETRKVFEKIIQPSE